MSRHPDLFRRPAARLRSVRMILALSSLSTIALPLAGCGRQSTPTGNNRIIACGPLDAPLQPVCTLEVDEKSGALHLILRQPEGGFRRLLWPSGGALMAADGAEAIETLPLNGGGVEVRIGGWRYRIERKGGGLP